MNRDLLHKELIRDEGKKLIAYKDSVGLWTIGVGHLLGQEARMLSITEAECRALLNSDIDNAEAIVEELLGEMELDDVRYRAMVNLAFNLGGKLADFGLFLGAIRDKDWGRAALHLLHPADASGKPQENKTSKWAKQVGPGRSERIAKMIGEGVAP